MKKWSEDSVADKCPKCGHLSYSGGYCFGCAVYRPKRRQGVTSSEIEGPAEFMSISYNAPVDPWVNFIADMKKQGTSKRKTHVVSISEQNLSEAALLVQGVVEPYGSTSEGQLVRAFVVPWRTIVNLLKKDWMVAFKIPPRIWEEMIAAAFEQDGYDEVTLTPRSGDFGRDVIAVKMVLAVSESLVLSKHTLRVIWFVLMMFAL
jgi:hypothetical protein